PAHAAHGVLHQHRPRPDHEARRSRGRAPRRRDRGGGPRRVRGGAAPRGPSALDDARRAHHAPHRAPRPVPRRSALRDPPGQLEPVPRGQPARERRRQGELVLSPSPARIPVGLNVWSRLMEDTFPYLDQTVAPFDSLWFPDHVQYGAHKVAEGWSLLAYALARYPDKRGGHEVLCNSFRNPALLAKMVATAQVLSGGRVVLGIGAGWNEGEYRAYGWRSPPAPGRTAQLP